MCTGLRLTCADGSVVHGRTAEFAMDLGLEMIHVPVGTHASSRMSTGQGARWATRYAVIGAAALGSESVLDGINDAGLSAGGFYFPGYAEYSSLADTVHERAVSPVDYVQWILANCGSVAELRSRIGEVAIVDGEIAAWGGVPPFHYIVFDPDGSSIVIEPLGGTLVVSDNPLGVLTNSPDFDFHLKHLSMYLDLDPHQIDSGATLGIDTYATGSGTGSMHLPGDFTPPSRFVRAAFYSATHTTPVDSAAGVHEVLHLLNQFDIPHGSVLATGPDGVDRTDWTLATLARDPAAGSVYYRTYGDQTIRKVCFSALPSGAEPVQRISMGPAVGDVTPVDDVSASLAESLVLN